MAIPADVLRIVFLGREVTPLVVLAVQVAVLGLAYGAGRLLWGPLRASLGGPVGQAAHMVRPVISNRYLILAVAIINPIFWVLMGSTSMVTISTGIALFVMLAVGLNIVVGYTGLLDLGYVAFYAVGAYTFGLLGSSQLADLVHRTVYLLVPAGSGGEGFHISMWLVLPLSGLLAAAFGALIGYPTLRLRGDYLAIVTLGFGEITRIFAVNLNHPVNITNGALGIYSIDPIWIGPYSFGISHDLFGFTIPSFVNYYYLLVVLILITIFFVSQLTSSRIGRAWQAIREDELAAEAVGINTRNMKLVAYASGGFFGGLAGVIFAASQHFIDPTSFRFDFSILILVMVVVGGMGNIPGAVLGAVVVSAAYFLTGQFGEFRIFAFGVILVLMVILRPQGLLPSRVRQRELLAAEIQPDQDIGPAGTIEG